MGIGIVILMQLFGIFVLSAAIAIIWSVTTYFTGPSKKRKRRILLALISPFIGLYTVYFVALTGSLIVSEYKDIDIGIGDAWYVPLSDHCRLLFIDIPEQAFIECDGSTIISDVWKIQQVKSKIYIHAGGKYYLLDLENQDVKEFTNGADFKSAISKNKIILKEAMEFYISRRNEIAGPYLIAAGVFAVIVGLSVIYVVRRLILRIT